MTTKTTTWDDLALARKLNALSGSLFAARPKLDDVPANLVNALRVPSRASGLDAAAVERVVEAVKDFAAWRQEQRGWLFRKSLERSRRREDHRSFKYVIGAFIELAEEGWPLANRLREALLSYCVDEANEPVLRFFAASAGFGLCDGVGYRAEQAIFDEAWVAAMNDWFGPRRWAEARHIQTPRPVASIPQASTYAEQRFRELTGPGSHMGNYEASRIVQQETGLWIERPL